MRSTLTYIFKHSYFKDVCSKYEEIKTKYSEAYKLWSEFHSISDNGDFKSKEIIAKAYSEITKVNSWRNIYIYLLNNASEGLRWFFQQKAIFASKGFHYTDYKQIAESKKEIETLDGYWRTYNSLMQTDREAIFRYTQKVHHSYGDIKIVALNKSKIKSITSVLEVAHYCASQFNQAWQIFSRNRTFEEIPYSDLIGISTDKFSVKENYLKYYQGHETLIKLIFGKDLLSLDSFTEQAIDQEQEIMTILSNIDLPDTGQLNRVIHSKDEKQLKRAILDSKYYGYDFNFSDSYNISQFYKLRNDFDNIKVGFDLAVKKIKENEAVVKSINKDKHGKSVIFIEDYLSIVTEGSPLFVSVEQYKAEKEKRNRAQSIKSMYQNGFDAMYNSIDLNTCALSIIIDIIDNEHKISEKDRTIREEEQRKDELSYLYSCIEHWETLYCGLKYSYLINYYPTTCDFEATDDEWNDRWLVWNFKNTPGKTTAYHHQEALKNIVPRLIRMLQDTFGVYLSKLTLVCIPASSEENTYARFYEFSELLCKKTGMENSYDKISVVKSKVERRNGGTSIDTDNLQFDNAFFRGRYIILFDDVITRGDSMSLFQLKMQQLGATVIAGISIGKTKHLR